MNYKLHRQYTMGGKMGTGFPPVVDMSVELVHLVSASRRQREHAERLGVPPGRVCCGTGQAEDSPDPQHGLAERAQKSAADRRQEGQAHPWLEGGPRHFLQGTYRPARQMFLFFPPVMLDCDCDHTVGGFKSS